MGTPVGLSQAFTREVVCPSRDRLSQSQPLPVGALVQGLLEGGLRVGEAIFGTLLIILFGGMGLAVLFEVSNDWEDQQKEKYKDG